MRPFADFTDIMTIIALIVAAFGVVVLLTAPKVAARIMRKRYPQLKEGEEGYGEKHLDITVKLKGIGAAITVIACVISLF